MLCVGERDVFVVELASLDEKLVKGRERGKGKKEETELGKSPSEYRG